MESPPRISMLSNLRPLCPSTFIANRLDVSFIVMEEILTDFDARLYTLRRAVGVPTSVKTVSKLSVSVLKVSMSEGEVVKSSSIHEGRKEAMIAPMIRGSRYFIGEQDVIRDLKNALRTEKVGWQTENLCNFNARQALLL